jgi:hypothetical protein
MKPIFIEQFYHDGRGPELQKVHYKSNGRVIVGTDYYLADQPYTPENLRHVKFIKPVAFMLTPEEVENYKSIFNPWEGDKRFALVDFGKSSWLQQFSSSHLANCSHYRCMFYDEFLDVICEGIEIGHGGYSA